PASIKSTSNSVTRIRQPGLILCLVMLASLEDLIRQDVRFGLRTLRKNPAFTVVAVLLVVVGVGADAAVFMWMLNILLRPFAGVTRQEDLMIVTSSRGSTIWEGLSSPDLKDLANLKEIFDGVIGSAVTRADLTVGGQSEWIYGQLTTANFFSVLGVK